MEYFKTFENFINESSEIDSDLEDIRHFRGSILQFKEYWERKMKVPFNPHDKVEYEYPVKRVEQDSSLPYQDFVNGESSQVKNLLKNRKKGN